MNRDLLLKGLLVVLLLAAGTWLSLNTEWVDHEVRTPPKGEALTNELYATQQLVRQLGGKVVKPEGLDRMPPVGATLLLGAWHWDLFPERERALRAWVQQGGHLAIQAHMLDNERLQGWLPFVSQEEEDDEDEKSPVRPRQDCERVSEPAGVPPAYPGRPQMADGYRLCGGWGSHRLLVKKAPQWSVAGRFGDEMVRLSVGRGSVTVLANGAMLENSHIFEGDNALLSMAALQVRSGREIWFVDEEARPPLLEWIWTEGWIAVVLGLTALLASLWRGAVRFGPLAGRSVVVRRSMVEQLSGTAQFLRWRGPGALHAAQVRALEDTARSHLRDYARLDRQARARALAAATGLDANGLASALDKGLRRTDRDLPAALQLLETARRRLSSRPRRATESSR